MKLKNVTVTVTEPGKVVGWHEYVCGVPVPTQRGHVVLWCSSPYTKGSCCTVVFQSLHKGVMLYCGVPVPPQRGHVVLWCSSPYTKGSCCTVVFQSLHKGVMLCCGVPVPTQRGHVVL